MLNAKAILPADAVILLDDTARRCVVTYMPHFLSEGEAGALFDALRAVTPFHAEAPVMFGRPIEVRRRTYSFGEPGTRYRYSGVERVAAPGPAELVPTVERIRARAGARFTFALCNLYPDGAAGLGWHADDERDLVAGAPIASLSLGAERDFQMRRGRKGPAVLSVSLGHGSLLVMSGATQEHYQHHVPKRARCTSPRLNLTFRVMS
jgi:alkylated DNA repair dioxygenase AlkB